MRSEARNSIICIRCPVLLKASQPPQSCHLIAEVAVDQETGEDAEEAGFEDAKQVLLLQSHQAILAVDQRSRAAAAPVTASESWVSPSSLVCRLADTNIRKGHGNLHAGP